MLNAIRVSSIVFKRLNSILHSTGRVNFSNVNIINHKMHSTTTTISGKNLTVKVLPALEDNFMYLIIDENTKEAAIVDPVDPNTASLAIEEAKINVKKILTTHHHWDHAGGNERMCEKHKNIEVLGGDNRIESINRIVSHNDIFYIGSLKVKCLATPCHTSGHICYLITTEMSDDPPAIFTGDTLFVGGCGKFFEGTPDQMYKALIHILGSLPDDTHVYCGHEYTCKNLEFGLTVEPNNEEMKKKFEWAKMQRDKMLPTVPSTIGSEKKINPFMRVDSPSYAVMAYTAANNAVDIMAILRKQKDNFRK